MIITQTIRNVVADELGHYLEDDNQISNAVAFYSAHATRFLKSELQEKSDILHESGGRGVELADEIDNLRIVIALRNAKLVPIEFLPRPKIGMPFPG